MLPAVYDPPKPNNRPVDLGARAVAPAKNSRSADGHTNANQNENPITEVNQKAACSTCLWLYAPRASLGYFCKVIVVMELQQVGGGAAPARDAKPRGAKAWARQLLVLSKKNWLLVIRNPRATLIQVHKTRSIQKLTLSAASLSNFVHDLSVFDKSCN